MKGTKNKNVWIGSLLLFMTNIGLHSYTLYYIGIYSALHFVSYFSDIEEWGTSFIFHYKKIVGYWTKK